MVSRRRLIFEMKQSLTIRDTTTVSLFFFSYLEPNVNFCFWSFRLKVGSTGSLLGRMDSLICKLNSIILSNVLSSIEHNYQLEESL